MELRDGYKQTEVGVIPEDWVVSKLHEITASVSSGKSNTKSKSGKYPIYGSTGIIGHQNYFDYEGDKILVARVGANAGTVNSVAGKYCVSDNTLMISYQKSIDIKFGYFQLVSKNLNSLVFGSGQPLITGAQLKGLALPLPRLREEQTAIANALSDADALIQVITRLIAKKRQIKQGAMQTLLNPYENGRLKEGWVMKSILELADNKKELFDDGDWIEAEHITNKGIRLIQTGNIGVGRYIEKEAKKYIYKTSFEKLHCKPLREGDLLICRLAAPAGRACVLPGIGEKKVITSVDVTIFRPREDVANRIYLANLFSTSDWFNKVTESVGGTTHKRISRGSLGKINIALPHIDEQNKTAIILKDMDADIAALETKLAKTQQIKQGMMQNLLTGHIRLVKPQSKTGAAA